MASSMVKMDKRKKKILIVDDDKTFTGLLSSALKLHDNYEVRVENDPLHAVEVGRKYLPDLAILDVVMPEIDGGEVNARFQADPVLKNVPIIFLTSMVQPNEVEQHNGMIGGSFYLSKPVSLQKLIDAVAERIGI